MKLEDLSLLRRGNMIYYRMVGSSRLYYGKLSFLVNDSTGKPIKLFIEYKKNGGTLERDLMEISEVFKKSPCDSHFEITQLKRQLKS
jgi:hypothetical protein